MATQSLRSMHSSLNQKIVNDLMFHCLLYMSDVSLVIRSCLPVVLNVKSIKCCHSSSPLSTSLPNNLNTLFNQISHNKTNCNKYK